MKVVVATDRSETAQRAVAWAAELAQSSGGELILLNVRPTEETGGEDLLRSDAAAFTNARAVFRVGRQDAGKCLCAPESALTGMLWMDKVRQWTSVAAAVISIYSGSKIIFS